MHAETEAARRVSRHNGISVEDGPVVVDDILKLWRQRVGTVGISDAVHSTLREAIVVGVLSAGTRLGEEELSELFGVSRTPIREALMRLESEHLADRIQPRGLVVRRVSPEEILEVYLVRQHLAALAAGLAARRVTPVDIAQLRWLNDQLREAPITGDLQRIRSLSFELHRCVSRASGNGMVQLFMQQLDDRIRRFPGFTFTYGTRVQEMIDEHEQLIEALAAGDAEAASRIAREHHAHAMQVRIAMLEDGATASTGGADGSPVE